MGRPLGPAHKPDAPFLFVAQWGFSAGETPAVRGREAFFLFVSEGYYWVYVCGSYGGVEAEDDAYCDADAD